MSLQDTKIRVCPHSGLVCLCRGKECANKPLGWGTWADKPLDWRNYMEDPK